MNVIVAIGDVLIGNQVLEQGQGRLDAIDDEFIERTTQTHHAFDAVTTVHDELADKAVIVRRDAVAGINARIHANAETAWRVVMRDKTR